jgi:HEAT repeat protein
METADAVVRAALLVATKDKIPCVRLEAAESLYRFDPQNPVVLATILPALYDKEATVRGSACSTLERIGVPVATPAIPRFIGLLSDENGTVRLYAINALSKMAGQKANIAAAIPALKVAAGDPNGIIRHAAQDCLKRVK